MKDYPYHILIIFISFLMCFMRPIELILLGLVLFFMFTINNQIFSVKDTLMYQQESHQPMHQPIREPETILSQMIYPNRPGEYSVKWHVLIDKKYGYDAIYINIIANDCIKSNKITYHVEPFELYWNNISGFTVINAMNVFSTISVNIENNVSSLRYILFPNITIRYLTIIVEKI